MRVRLAHTKDSIDMRIPKRTRFRFNSVTFLSLLLLLLIGSCSSVQAEPALTEDSAAARALKLPVYRWHDPNVQHRGNIVAIHGLTFCSRSYDDLAKFLASEGFTFYATDMRGFGKWKTQGAALGGDNRVHFDATRRDVESLMRFVRDEEPDAPLFGLGESLGSNVALRVAAEQPGLVDGLILSSPGHKMRFQLRLRTLLDVPRCAIWRHKPMDWTPYVKHNLTEDPKLLAPLLKDERLNRKMSIAELIMSVLENKRGVKAASALPSDFPLLIIGGTCDRMFKCKTLPEMVKGFNNNHNSQIWFMKDRGHLLFEHQQVKPCMARILTNWLDKQTGASTTVASHEVNPKM